MSKKVYPIIVNYNSGKELYKAVVEILNFPSVTKIIVVDNGSKDGSLRYIDSINDKNRLILIKNKQNLGFYKALNMAFEKAISLGADYVMPLDFDLIFDFDFIGKLLKRKADFIAAALKSKNGQAWEYDYGGLVNWHKGSQQHIILNSKINENKLLFSTKEPGDSNRIDFVSGGCTLINLDIVKKIGLYDEDYFLYWGDVDYSLRANRAGFMVSLDPMVVVHHRYELTREKLHVKKLIITFFDNLTFIRKEIRWYFKPLAYLNLFALVVSVVLKVLAKKYFTS